MYIDPEDNTFADLHANFICFSIMIKMKKKMPELKANTAYLRPFGELVWTKMIRTKLWVSLAVHIVRICLQCRRPGFYFWVGKTPWRRERLPTPVLLPGEFHGEISLVLQSMGSQTVVYNWATNIHTHTHTHTPILFWRNWGDAIRINTTSN